MKFHSIALTSALMRAAVISGSLFCTGTAFGGAYDNTTTFPMPATVYWDWSNDVGFGGEGPYPYTCWNDGTTMAVATWTVLATSNENPWYLPGIDHYELAQGIGLTAASSAYSGVAYWWGGGTPTGGTVRLGAYFKNGTLVEAWWSAPDPVLFPHAVVDISWWQNAQSSVSAGLWHQHMSEQSFMVTGGHLTSSEYTLDTEIPVDDWIAYNWITPIRDWWWNVWYWIDDGHALGQFEWQWNVPVADWPVPQGTYRLFWGIYVDVHSNLTYTIGDPWQDDGPPGWDGHFPGIVYFDSWNYSEAHDMVCTFTPDRKSVV